MRVQDALKVQGRRLVPPFNASAWAADTHARHTRRQKQPTATAADSLASGNSEGFQLPPGYQRKYGVVAPPAFQAIVETFEGSELASVLAAGGRAEVWARPVVPDAPSNGKAYALLFFNNGMGEPANITCDTACWSNMYDARTIVAVRDVWTHSNNGTVTGSLTVTNVPVNGTVLVKLTSVA